MSAREESILNVTDLQVHFNLGSSFLGLPKVVQAVNGVSFSLHRQETLSLVGESGCGKTTIARAIMGLVQPTSGQVLLHGKQVSNSSTKEKRALQREMQFVFQDPFSSLNPRMRVQDILAEPLRNFKLVDNNNALQARLEELVDLVRLPRHALGRYPHEFSGGQRQRIGIARALSVNPKVLICDEAVSALDVSVQAQIVNLFRELQEQLSVSLLFISHDMAIVEHISDRIAVLYMGKIVEIGTPRELFSNARHPYTKALISAVPTIDRVTDSITLKGEVPSPLNPPAGCRFRTRCPLATQECLSEPLIVTHSPTHATACHHQQ